MVMALNHLVNFDVIKMVLARVCGVNNSDTNTSGVMFIDNYVYQ